jgi:hypothetical protein
VAEVPALLIVLLAAICLVAGCGSPADPASEVDGAALVGEEPVVSVHMLESRASALTLWRQARLRGRTLLYLGGSFDLVPAPDSLLARVAAFPPDTLSSLEAPVRRTAGAERVEGFDRRNVFHVAARLGIVREMIWVVPDGALDPTYAAVRLAELLSERFAGIPAADARSFRQAGASVRGELWGVPATICELGNIPPTDRPLLLDVDLQFLLRRRPAGAQRRWVPWIAAVELLDRLSQANVRTDFATVTLSTWDGPVPPDLRWMGRLLAQGLRQPLQVDESFEREWLDAHFHRLGGIPFGRRSSAGNSSRVARARPASGTAWPRVPSRPARASVTRRRPRHGGGRRGWIRCWPTMICWPGTPPGDAAI